MLHDQTVNDQHMAAMVDIQRDSVTTRRIQQRGESVRHTAGTDDVRTVQQKSLTDQRHVTLAADEALVVPVTVVERRKLRRPWSCTDDIVDSAQSLTVLY